MIAFACPISMSVSERRPRVNATAPVDRCSALPHAQWWVDLRDGPMFAPQPTKMSDTERLFAIAPMMESGHTRRKAFARLPLPNAFNLGGVMSARRRMRCRLAAR